MPFNLLLLPTLIAAWLLFLVGERAVKACSSSKARTTRLGLFFLLAVPGLLFPLYYLHLFDDALWFYRFRSLPFTELTAAGTGLFAGGLAAWANEHVGLSLKIFLALLLLGILLPHLKPVLLPLSDDRFTHQWEDDVCLQSTPSSCGPASAATLLRAFDVEISEQALARECFTYLGGTENWYLARAFRKRRFTVTFRIADGLPDDLHLPAIAGVRVGGAGHFIPLLRREADGTLVTGDPLSGLQTHPATDAPTAFDFTGFFMEIARAAPGNRR